MAHKQVTFHRGGPPQRGGVNRPAEPAAPGIPLRLTGLLRRGPDIVSCYLRLEPEDRQGKRYLLELKEAVSGVKETLARLAREPCQGVERDLERIITYAAQVANLPRTRGVAIFACGALKLFQAVPLPRVTRTRLRLDLVAHLQELAEVQREFGTVIAVVLDRAHARFFEVSALGAGELPCMRPPAMRGGKFHGDPEGAPGWGEADYHRRIREERHRHYAAVARQLERLDGRAGAAQLFLAGPGPVATEFGRFLPPALAGQVVGTARLNPTEVTPAAVYAAVLAARAPQEAAAERALVAALEEGLGTGWAVNGVRPTLGALARGQVRTLLLRPDVSGGGFRCGASGPLAQSRAECRGAGDVLPVSDLVGAAIEDAHRQGSSVSLIHQPAEAARIEGLAALLRFR